MYYFCAICMINTESLTDLNPKCRRLFVSLVSPYIRHTKWLRSCRILLCQECNRLIGTMMRFQQTLVKGVMNLVALEKRSNMIQNVHYLPEVINNHNDVLLPVVNEEVVCTTNLNSPCTEQPSKDSSRRTFISTIMGLKKKTALKTPAILRMRAAKTYKTPPSKRKIERNNDTPKEPDLESTLSCDSDFSISDNPDYVPGYERLVATSQVDHEYIDNTNGMAVLVTIKNTRDKRASKNTIESSELKKTKLNRQLYQAIKLALESRSISDFNIAQYEPESESDLDFEFESHHYLKSPHHKSKSSHHDSSSPHQELKLQHDLTSPNNDSKPSNHHTKSSHHDLSSPHQELKSQHDLKSPNNDSKSSNRDLSSLHHESKSQHDLRTSYHDSKSPYHDSKSSHRDSKSSHPDTKLSNHDSKLSHHDTKSSHRDSKLSHDDSKSSHHDSKPSCHDSKPSHHVSKSSNVNSDSTLSCESDYEDADHFPNIMLAKAFSGAAAETGVSGDVQKKAHLVLNPPSEWPCTEDSCPSHTQHNKDHSIDSDDSDVDRDHVDISRKECCSGTALKNGNTMRLIKAPEPTAPQKSQYDCAECGVDCRSKTQMKLHLVTLRHKLRSLWRFQCDICKRKFENKTVITEHIEREHLAKEANKCPMCAAAFHSARALHRHAAAHLLAHDTDAHANAHTQAHGTRKRRTHKRKDTEKLPVSRNVLNTNKTATDTLSNGRVRKTRKRMPWTRRRKQNARNSDTQTNVQWKRERTQATQPREQLASSDTRTNVQGTQKTQPRKQLALDSDTHTQNTQTRAQGTRKRTQTVGELRKMHEAEERPQLKRERVVNFYVNKFTRHEAARVSRSPDVLQGSQSQL